MFSLRFLLSSMATLGFVLFLARCAGIAAAEEPSLAVGMSAWTGETQADTNYSYSAWVFSNAAAPSVVTVTMDLDRRVTALPDHRSPECAGVRPVVCTVTVSLNHPASLVFSVRVNHGVCGLFLRASAAAVDDRGYRQTTPYGGVSLNGRCLVYVPIIKQRIIAP